MLDGLYKVNFEVPGGSGSGIVHAMDGKIWGGDDLMFYKGTYANHDNSVDANVKIGRHSHIPGMMPIFGRDNVTLTLSGRTVGNDVTFKGKAAEVPNVPFSATMVRLAD